MHFYLLSLQRFWQNAALVTLLLVPVVYGYGVGIPEGSGHCQTLLPVHSAYKPSTTTPPFKLEIYKKKYKAGSSIRMSLIGDYDFKGFTVQVRPYGNLGLSGDMQYGSFRDYPSYARGACFNNTSLMLTSLTQTSGMTKRRVDFLWVAPPKLQYPSCPDCLPNLNLQVWVTFVKDFTTFWLYRHDTRISYYGPKPPTEAPTTTPSTTTPSTTITTTSTIIPTTLYPTTGIVPKVVSIYDFEKYASETMPPDINIYVNSGATTQTTIKANTEVYKSYLFRPKHLVDVSKVETWVKTLYKTFSWPLGIAPMAHHDWVAADGEQLSARAAQNKGVVLCLSAQIGDRMEQVVSELHGHVWQEIHIYSDKNTTLDFVRRIENTGKISAIIIGIGISAIPIRYAKFTPPGPSQQAPRPAGEATPPPGLNPSMTWEDIKWLVTQTSLPVVLKGVMRREDAVKAASIGVAGVIVSNQGGRILDGVGTTLDALSEVVTAANGTRLDVYFDGGVRTGMDVVKAMILGAKLVFVGRPVMWGLHHSGQSGVEKVFDILQTEMVNTLKLIGAPSPLDLMPDMLIKGDSSTDIAMRRLGLN